VVDRLGLAEAALDRETTTFSGGQLARCGLAAVLLTQTDVLLLDEPTNDLDVDGLALLESFLEGRDDGLVVLSARPRLPGARRDRGARDRRVQPSGHGVRRRLRGLPRGAGEAGHRAGDQRAGAGGRAGQERAPAGPAPTDR